MRLKMFVRRNSSTVLTVLGSVGVVATAYATARATPKAMQLLKEAEEDKGEGLTVCEKIIVSTPIYLPAAILGITTVACIFSANMLNQRNQATIQSAYALLDQTYKDYRRKCKELYGEDADHRIIEALAVEESKNIHVSAYYISSDVDLSLEENASKPVLWYEENSHRFFEASLEKVLTAEYHLNRNYILRGETNLNELYSFLGLRPTDEGEVKGWAPYDCCDFWIEFNHVKSKLEDGTTFYILEMPFEPRLGYWEEPEW